ncbi:MAG: glycosyltransferase family 2 protein [Anaerolineaceae bacterium]|nr:glycosyltransferase family 2 protein [Anaerolineaceae bacterium]
MSKTSLSIVVPAYNESAGVAHTVPALQTTLDQLEQTYAVDLIFVNDGSKDDTEALLQAATADDPRMQIVTHPQNKGLGAAIKTGFAHSSGDIVVTTDFDGTYRFETIAEIVGCLVGTGADIVTASPYHPKGEVKNVPQYRLLFSFGASMLYRLLVRFNIHTWTALFRAYRRNVIENVTFESDDFLAGTELLVRAVQQGYRVEEFPTVLHSRVFGQSSLKIAKVTMAHLKFQSQLLWERLTFSVPKAAKKSTLPS